LILTVDKQTRHSLHERNCVTTKDATKRYLTKVHTVKHLDSEQMLPKSAAYQHILHIESDVVCYIKVQDMWHYLWMTFIIIVWSPPLNFVLELYTAR